MRVLVIPLKDLSFGMEIAKEATAKMIASVLN